MEISMANTKENKQCSYATPSGVGCEQQGRVLHRSRRAQSRAEKVAPS
jgi:hypothetical protein